MVQLSFFPSIFIWNNQKTVRLLFLLLSSRNLPCFHKSRYLFFSAVLPRRKRKRSLYPHPMSFLYLSPYRYHLSFPSYLSGPPFSPPLFFSFAAASFLSAIRSLWDARDLSTTAKNDAFPWSSKVIPKELTESAFEPRLSFI